MDGLLIIRAVSLAALAGCVCVTPVLFMDMKKETDMENRRDVFAPPRQPLKRTMSTQERRNRFIAGKIKNMQDARKYKDTSIGKIISLIGQSGLNIALPLYCLISFLFGALTAVLSYLMMHIPLLSIVVLGVNTVFTPYFILKKKTEMRQRKFTKHFGNALEMMVRGLDSGMPPQECFHHIAKDVPDPCGSVFKQIMSDVQMGISLSDSIEQAYVNMQTPELKFFACVISIQQQTGGNLVTILGNIAEVIRERAALKQKAKALSSEAKMSSIIVGALPFIVCAGLAAMDYSYISLLWHTLSGKIILGVAIGMLTLAMFIMNKMSKIDE